MHQGIIPISPAIIELLSKQDFSKSGLVSFSREIFLLDIVVAGTSYCSQKEELHELIHEGDTLRLQRDPANEHDPQAIACYLDDLRIGWVPRELNLIISRLMDAGKAFIARIESHRKINDWPKINCKIYMIE